MTNPFIEEFQGLITASEYEWQDRPKQFISDYLATLNHEMLVVESAELHADYVEFVNFLQAVQDTIPERTYGELLYVVAFLEEGKHNHVTLLGPTYFPDLSDVDDFIQAAGEFAEETRSLHVTLQEPMLLTKDSDSFTVRPLVITQELQQVHAGLAGLAELYNGLLAQPEYAHENFLPHITEVETLTDESAVLQSLTFSLHPGARINPLHAVNIAVANFS